MNHEMIPHPEEFGGDLEPKAVVPYTGTALAEVEEEEESCPPWEGTGAGQADAPADADLDVDPTAICIEIAQRLEEEGDEDLAIDGWSGDDPFEYAFTPQRIGEELIRRLPIFADLRGKEIDYLYREKDWKVRGAVAMGQMKNVTGLLRRYSGKDFVAMFSFATWKQLSSWQKVALVYHELRHASADGALRPHQFEGFFDELEVFGVRTFKDWERLRTAVANGGQKSAQLELGLAGVAPEAKS
jgi:hypothetical protein